MWRVSTEKTFGSAVICIDGMQSIQMLGISELNMRLLSDRFTCVTLRGYGALSLKALTIWLTHTMQYLSL